MKSRIPLLAFTASFFLASSSYVHAANIIADTVGVMNTNSKTILDATGSISNSTFASDMAIAFANNTGGVWNFDGDSFDVGVGETITLNYGTSLANSLVLTLGGQGINRDGSAGEPTSGSFQMGLAADASTRTFTLSTPLLSLGIFNTDRNDAGRFPVLTVTYLDTSTASTSGANADNTYFHGFSGTLDNPIVSFSLSQNAFVRYDDLGFIAVPEPVSGMLVLGGAGMLAISRRRRLKVRG